MIRYNIQNVLSSIVTRNHDFSLGDISQNFFYGLDIPLLFLNIHYIPTFETLLIRHHCTLFSEMFVYDACQPQSFI